MPKYKIADIVFQAKLLYPYTEKLCKDYEYFGSIEPAFSVEITREDVEAERVIISEYSDDMLESLALFRKLCDYALKNENAILFHSSAVMVDGGAYLFTAPSGTGKSTHARLWREMLGDRAVMINDDKPIIRYVDGHFYVYGTPWNGKHHLGTNDRAKIKAICKIYQAKQNVIRKLDAKTMLFNVLNQTIRPKEIENMDKLLVLIDKMLNSVDLYELGCNISKEAAELSYKTMSKGDHDEN